MIFASGASAQSDDFADGVLGSQWTLLEDAPAELSLVEQGGRLDVLAASPVSGATDALYLSNGPSGFRLSTASDFVITLDYALNGFADTAAVGDQLGLTFGVGRDLDGTDAAAIGLGLAKAEVIGIPIVGTALAEGHRIDDVQTENILNLLNPPLVDTFEISYDAAGDDLTLGVGLETFTLEDTVQAVWGADALFVSFGARGNGFSLDAGDAWLDNFTVVSGVVQAPPGDYNNDASVDQGDLDLVLLNWGDDVTLTGVPTGWINMQPTGLIGQNQLDGVLLNWGNTSESAAGVVPEPGAVAGVFMLGSLGLRWRH